MRTMNEKLAAYRKSVQDMIEIQSTMMNPFGVCKSFRDKLRVHDGLPLIKKIGLDVHGVITEHPEFLANQAKKIVEAGHQVHIMTGSRLGAKLEEQLLSYGFQKGIHYTHFFSITDHLIETGVEVTFKDGMPFADALPWNMAKGEYAILNELDCLWDDSPVYGRYMPETCWYFTYSKENFDKQLDQVLNGGRPTIGRK
jgi:hypothetical protein